MSTQSDRVNRAIVANEAYLAGENEHRLSPDAHAQYILSILGLSPGFWHEGVQNRKQVGLEPLDVLELAFIGKLEERLVSSRSEVAEAIERNNETARKAALAKRRGANF